MLLEFISSVYLICFHSFKHGQGQPRCPSRAGEAEGEDPGSSGANLQYAGGRQQPSGAAAAAGDAQRAGPDQEPAASEVQEPLHVRCA